MKEHFGQQRSTISEANESIIEGVVKNDEYYYYTKPRSDINLQPVNKTNVGENAKSSPWEIYHDYREYTVADRVIEALLEYRKIWNRVEDPWEWEYINFSFVGTDIAITPKYMSSLKEVDDQGNVMKKTFNVRMKEVFDSDMQEKGDIIALYEDKLADIKNIRLTKTAMEEYKGMATINRLILEMSEVGNRITQITRWAGDKSMLYSMMKSYGGHQFIPQTFEIDIDSIVQSIQQQNHDIDAQDIEEIAKQNIQNELEQFIGQKQGVYWVVKPVSGSRGVGMQFSKTEEVLENFYSWANSSYKVQKKEVRYAKWMISEFKQSFLWKLQNNNPESLKLCEYRYIGKGEKVLNKDRPPIPEQFKGQKTGLWNEAPVLCVFEKDGQPNTKMQFKDIDTGKIFQYIKTCNPSDMSEASNNTKKKQSEKYKKFREHKFADTKGRINKARLWFALDLSNGSYTVHVYNKVLFELCSVPFSGDYDNKQEVWTDVSEDFYGSSDEQERKESTYLLDGVNASRASELDLCYTIDWETGHWYKSTYDRKKNKSQNFPMSWNTVKKNFMDFFKVFQDATKDNVHCLSEGKALGSDFNTKGCFQYFGMDFIVDDNSNVWLLELNTRPWMGYGNWWQKMFDPYNIHIPHKWIFLESLLRTFVDTKFKRKPESLPYGESVSSECWKEVRKEQYVDLEQPVAILGKNIPVKGLANWVMTREIKNVLRKRGWGTFPYAQLVKNPKLVMQGMTPYINYLIKKAGESTGFKGDFQDRMEKVYPDLLRANVINRIFPLVYYLGNKVEMARKLKMVYDNQDFVANTEQWRKQIPNPVPYNRLIPETFFVNKNKSDWRENLFLSIVMAEPEQPLRWIAKPAYGKQGTGIHITDPDNDEKKSTENSTLIYEDAQGVEITINRPDIKWLIERIDNDKDNPDEKDWVVSLYLDDPLLFFDRKTHIRVFVLVNNQGGEIKSYVMEPHLLFLAGLPYEKAGEFYTTYFTPKSKQIINDIIVKKGYSRGDTKGIVDVLSKYKDLTNLAKGKELFLTYVKRPEENVSNYDLGYRNPTDVEKALGVRSNWFKSDGTLNENFGYKILSYNAEKLFDKLHKNNYGSYRECVVPNIERLIKQVILSVKDDINCINDNSLHSDGCYHYLAFDIMLDRGIKSLGKNEKGYGKPYPWLLEVNVNPGLQAPKSKVKPGGINRFMNSIFDYTLRDRNTLDVVDFTTKKPQTYNKDTHVWELVESIDNYPEEYERKKVKNKDVEQTWVKVLYKKGETKKYRYSKEPGGPLYNSEGVYKQNSETFRNTKDKDWTKGFEMPDVDGKLNGKYYVSKKLRGLTKEQLERDYADVLVKSKMYPENLFHEVLTLQNSANLKSQQHVGSVLLSREMSRKVSPTSPPPEEKKPTNVWDDFTAYILANAGFFQDKEGKTKYIPPEWLHVMAQAKMMKKILSDEGKSKSDGTPEGDFKEYMNLVMKYAMAQSLIKGGRNGMMGMFRNKMYTPGVQVIPAYLNQMFGPMFRGQYGFRGGNMMNHLMQLYMYQQIFDTKTEDKRLISFLFPQLGMYRYLFGGDEGKSSKFGDHYSSVDIPGIPGDVNIKNLIVALADSGAGYAIKPMRRNSFWGDIYGWNGGIPILPDLPDGFEGCLNLKGSGRRGSSGMCIDPEGHPWMCTADALARELKRMGIPKELVHKAQNKSKDALVCLLGVYGTSGIIDMSWPFASGSPENNPMLMYMYKLMMDAGITSNPFGYLKEALKHKISQQHYGMLMQMLNSGVGNDFYGVNLINGGSWVPGMEGMLALQALQQ